MNHAAERERVSSSQDYKQVMDDLRNGRVLRLKRKQPMIGGAYDYIMLAQGASGTKVELSFALWRKQGIIVTAADAIDYFGKILAWKQPCEGCSDRMDLIVGWEEVGKALKLEDIARMRAPFRWLYLRFNK